MLGVIVVVSCLAGACAYLITAGEMRHHFRSAGAVRREAWRAAATAAAFFALVGAVVVRVLFRGVR